MLCAAKGFVATRPGKWLTAAAMVCAVGMGTKEIIVLAPVFVLLYDCFFVSGSIKAALNQRRAFYTFLFSTWVLFVFFYTGSSRSETVSFDTPDLGVWDYLLTQLTVILHYLRLSFWPHPLVLDYHDWPIVREFSSVLIPGVILLTMFVTTIGGLKSKAWWAFLGVWFFLILAPTSSILPIPTEIMSERRMYLPLAAVIVLIIFFFDALWFRTFGHRAENQKIFRKIPVILAAIVIVIQGQVTWERNQDYRTAVSIWSDTVQKRPNNYRAYNNLGESYAREGKFSEAVEPFREAIQLKENYPEAYRNLGTTLSNLGQAREAITMLKRSLELNPSDSLTHYNIGNAYLRINDLNNAVKHYQQAITINPSLAMAHGNLGLLLMSKGDLAGAELHLLALVELVPQAAEARTALAELRVAQGRIDEAIRLYRQALQLQPNSRDIADRLNTILANYPEKR
jgi:Flp pilus assembly protein TadD